MPAKRPKLPQIRTKTHKVGNRVTSRSKLIKEADRLMSLYVRQKNADKDGMVPCFTCGKIWHYKKLTAGHYITRIYKYTRWDLNNVRPQCRFCNLYLYGNSHLFRENLVGEIGEGAVKEMEQRAKKLFIEKDDFIQDRIEFFESLLGPNLAQPKRKKPSDMGSFRED